MPGFERYIQEALDLLRQLVSAEAHRTPQWVVGLIGVVIGSLLTFLFGLALAKRQESRSRKLLCDALYQEIADNFEALCHWVERCGPDFDQLKGTVGTELAFAAYEGAQSAPSLFYLIPEHGWLHGVYRELGRIRREIHVADSTQVFELLSNAVSMIKDGDKGLPRTKDKIRSKLSPAYHDKIK